MKKNNISLNKSYVKSNNMEEVSKGVSLTELEQYLWKAANILRGPIDNADFKAYIFPLLFFKRISDTYDEEYSRALKESDVD